MNARSPSRGWVRAVHHLPWAVLCAFAALGLFGLPWQLGLSPAGVVAAGLAMTWLALTAAPLLSRMAAGAESPPRKLNPADRRALAALLAAGVVLRAGYVLLVAPVQLSDMAEYLASAQGLLDGHGYRQLLNGHLLFAYRAPGYPFLLAAVLWLTGGSAWAPALLNLACHGAAGWLLNDLTARLAVGRVAALSAAALFAAWPSGIMSTGLAITEPASLLLLLAVAWGSVRVRSGGQVGGRAGGVLASRPVMVGVTGVALGLGALVRPSLLPLPALLLLLAALDRPGRRRHSVAQALAALLIAAACIAPWTLRNHLRLGAVVAVSTNGGDNLYRANNPLASGGFTPAGEHDFTRLLPDEVAWNQASSAAARRWIADHPLAFARLALRKALIFMGDDATGAYWSLQRAHGRDGAGYAAALAVSNAWWLLLCGLLLGALWRQRAVAVGDPRLALLMWLAIGLPLVHAVFEAQPRYHMPLVGILLCLIAALLGARPAAGSGRGGARRGSGPPSTPAAALRGGGR